MEHEENPIESHLNELFKKFIPEEDAPDSMKKEIFQSLDTINQIGDIADLFTGRLVKTEMDFLDFLDGKIMIEEKE